MHYSGTLARTLLPILDPLQQQISNMQSRIVPSAFDGSDTNLRAAPMPHSWTWQTLATYLQALKTELLIHQLPTFWQLGPFVFAAARGKGVPLLTLDVGNYPLDKAALLYAGATTVVCEPHEADAICTFLREANVVPPQSFVLVHAADASGFATPLSVSAAKAVVAHEVHLWPGVPVLVQCEHTATSGTAQFHISDTFVWDGTYQTPLVRTSALLFPLEVKFPFGLKDCGTCPCGKQLLSRS